MPGGQAYMVWLNRNGKARGTQLVWATPGRATFDESVSVRCTLYRTKEGSFLAKDFELQVHVERVLVSRARLNLPPTAYIPVIDYTGPSQRDELRGSWADLRQSAPGPQLRAGQAADHSHRLH